MFDTTKLNGLEMAVVDILGENTLSQTTVCAELYNKYNVAISKRQLRRVYADIRNKFADGVIDYTVCHCSNGNYLTKDAKTIKKDNADSRATAYALLRYSYARDRRLGLIGQMSLEEYTRMIIQEEQEKVKGGAEHGE